MQSIGKPSENGDLTKKNGDLVLVGGLEPWNFMTFHLGIIIPSDEHIFQRGRSTTKWFKWAMAIPPQRSTVFRERLPWKWRRSQVFKNVWIHAAFLQSKTEGRQQWDRLKIRFHVQTTSQNVQDMQNRGLLGIFFVHPLDLFCQGCSFKMF